MENHKKLLLAHLFALGALLLIMAASNLLKLNLSIGEGVTFLHVLLVVVPQVGFGYLLWNTFKTEKTLG